MIYAKKVLLTSFILVCNLNCSNQSDSSMLTSFFKYGVIDKDGDLIIAPDYEELGIFSEGLAKALKNGRFGFINEKNEVIIDFQFEETLNFNEGMAAVFQDGKIGFVDKNGNIAIPLEFEEVSSFVNGYAAVRRGEKVGYINTRNESVIPHLYDNISFLSEGLIDVEQDGKWGYVDISGNTVIDFVLDRAFPFKDEIAYVEIEGKYGYISKQGKFLIAPELELLHDRERVVYALLVFREPKILKVSGDSASSSGAFFSRVKWISDGLIIYREDDKYGFIDIEGNPQIPAHFTFVLPFSEGQAFVFQENTYHKQLIDTTGKVLRTFDTKIGILNEKIHSKKRSTI